MGVIEATIPEWETIQDDGIPGVCVHHPDSSQQKEKEEALSGDLTRSSGPFYWMTRVALLLRAHA